MTGVPVVLPGLEKPLRSVFVVERQGQTWSNPECVAIFSDYDKAAQYLEAYLQTGNGNRAARVDVAEWYVDAAQWPLPAETDNPDDPDPLDGRFDTSRSAGIEVTPLPEMDKYGRRYIW